MITQVFLLFTLINASRSNMNIPQLKLYPKLEQMANIRAKDLYEKKQWSHAGWEKTFIGLECSYMGENLSKNFSSTTQEHNALMNSKIHRNNIIKESYNTIGIGIYKNITVELFCKKN